MESNLEALTRKIYQEGVQKATQEGEHIVAQARKEAAQLKAAAEAEAEQIRKEARQAAEELKRNALADLKLAAGQAISDIKNNLHQVIVAQTVAQPLEKLFTDSAFLEKLLLELAGKWKNGEAMHVAFDAHLKEEAIARLKNTLAKDLPGVQFSAANLNANGFTIKEQQGGYVLAFTDETFTEFFRPFVQKTTAQLLFG